MLFESTVFCFSDDPFSCGELVEVMLVGTLDCGTLVLGTMPMQDSQQFSAEFNFCYKVDGSKDAFCQTIEKSSLKFLVETQPDFIEDETQLQHDCSLIGAIVDRASKCHPEMDGEEIEHVWAMLKNECESSSLSQKKGKEKHYH